MADVTFTGITENDGSGDSLRTAFQQINARFQQLLGTLSQITWAPGLAIEATPARQWTIVGGLGYVAASNHTAGATFAADLAAGKWLAADVVQVLADLADTVSVLNGGAKVGYAGDKNYAVKTLGWAVNQDGAHAASVTGVDTTGTTDSTAAINALHAVMLSVYFGPGEYKLSDHILLRDNATIRCHPQARFVQTASNRSTFRANGKTRVTIDCNGAQLYGKGDWSAAWTGNSGHEDWCIALMGCTHSRVLHPYCQNGSAAGIAVFGGEDILIESPVIEGTHTHGVPLTVTQNYQMGIYVRHDPTHGAIKGLRINSPDISGVAQGILVEHEVGVALDPNTTVVITSPNIHDIPAQHAFYVTCGGVAITSPACTNIALSALKVQSGTPNADIKGVSCEGLVANNVGSHLIEVATTGTGNVTGVAVDGIGTGIGGRVLSVLGPVRDSDFDLIGNDVTDSAISVAGSNVKRLNIRMKARNVGQNGMIVTATNSDMKVWLDVQDPAQINTNASGVDVASASAVVKLFDPVIKDSTNRMAYGIYASVAGGVAEVYGSAELTGARLHVVRDTGNVNEWPTKTTLQGASGDFFQGGNVRSSQPIVARLATTSASNLILWNENLADESAYLFTAELVGKLAGSGERKVIKTTCCVYRDGAGAVIQGSADEDVAIASGAFAGVYSWGVSGNQIRLLANSGGAATYNWVARITRVEVL